MSTLPIPSSVKQIYKQTKNTVLQVPEIERKVKEATSNEKWGPTSTQMREIAQATFSYHDLPLIMNALWRRLNDHGKYWRHVYKSLLLIDYLIRNGSEQVVRECRDHIVAIQTLTEFQYIDEKDQDVGLSVRERAKQIVEFVHDEKRIKMEREKAKNTAKKFLVGMGSDAGGSGGGYYGDSYDRDRSESYNNDRYDYESGNNNSKYSDDSYEQEQYNSSYNNSNKDINYSRESSRDSSFRAREEEPRRPRAASNSSSSPNPSNYNQPSSRSNQSTVPETTNLFDLNEVMNAPPPSKTQEIDFFNTPSNNFNSNSFNSNSFQQTAPNVNGNQFNSFTPFQSASTQNNTGGFSEPTNNGEWAAFPSDNNSTVNNSNQSQQLEQKKDTFDPWAASHLFNLGGLSEKEQNKTVSTTNKTPMGAIPTQNKASNPSTVTTNSKPMGAPNPNVNAMFAGPVTPNVMMGQNYSLGMQQMQMQMQMQMGMNSNFNVNTNPQMGFNMQQARPVGNAPSNMNYPTMNSQFNTTQPNVNNGQWNPF